MLDQSPDTGVLYSDLAAPEESSAFKSTRRRDREDFVMQAVHVTASADGAGLVLHLEDGGIVGFLDAASVDSDDALRFQTAGSTD